MAFKPKLHHVTVRAVEEVSGELVLVQLGKASLFEVLANRDGGLGQVVVGNLCKEEVVGNVPVGDVVVKPIDAKPIRPIHSLEGGIDKLPVLVAVHLRLRIVVLQVRDCNKPPAIDECRPAVPIGHLLDVIVEQVEQ